MPEDAGKKRFIKDFLVDVQSGTGFNDDIRIERTVRQPGSDGEGSVARSLSGQSILNITQLLEDDLKHTFDEGYFTFRFVAALVGSGKTSLLAYLKQLTETKPTYENHSVVVEFQLSDISRNFQKNFMDNLYQYMFADTFYQLLHNNNLSLTVRDVARKILENYLGNAETIQLGGTDDLNLFKSKFQQYINCNMHGGLEQFFFEIISKISKVDPKFSFVYLIDELDALEAFQQEIQETRLLFKQLIRKAFTKFQSKIRVLIYLVGTSNNVDSFIGGDSVIKSLVGNSVINLSKGSDDEFSLIRDKINERIKGAYKGYQNFDVAWNKIQNIKLKPTNTLREFCQEYAFAVLSIHNEYFSEVPEQVFEGNARQLIEAECRKTWSSYLSKVGYTLSVVSTTKILEGHAFDGYIELLHNNKLVARAFGEAKNYGLLTKHLEVFEQWLNDVKFKSSTTDASPTDIAFMIAPSCSPLLQRKLELKNIKFIQVDKVIIDKPKQTKLVENQDLDKLNVTELKKMAKNANIKRYSKMKKPELINVIKQLNLISSTCTVTEPVQLSLDNYLLRE